ncbi:MAG TPA: hypothetical protein VKT82_07080 [Ktedonobacterales bacterium]|nr:hypothetical protein [Ktedonobacterales bacterium]
MMNSQSFNRFQRSPFVEDPRDQPQPPGRPKRAGPLRQLWNAWLWLTGPRPERFASAITGQERLRRSRLISALLLLVAAVMALLIPSAFSVAGLWQPILIQATLAVLALLLNRSGLVTGSGLAIIVLADLSISQNIVRQPYGLTNTTLADLYLLVIPILIAGMVLPNIFIPITGIIQVLISVAIFRFLHHDTLLAQEIQKVDGNMGYTSVLGPILLHVCGTGIVWLYAWSVDRAILRADRAEELAEARAHIDEQARQIAEQKQRLEEGIQTIQEVQARVANGEYSARVSLQGNELLPLGVSFNIMAERLSRVERIEQEYQHLENALRLLLDACEKLARGASPVSLRATGTPVDRVFPFLTRLQQLSTQLTQGSALAEDLRAVLERQIEHLTLAETRLISSLSLANDLAIQTVQTLSPPAIERTSGPLDAQSKSETPGAATQISALLDKQITLLEQVKKYDEHARDLGTRCMQGARILSQRLKETG